MKEIKLKKKSSFKIGICITFNPVFTHIFKVCDIIKDFQEFASIGYSGIELSIRDINDINWLDFNNQLEKNNLELVTIATGLVRKIDNISLMDQDEEKRKMAVSRINSMINHLYTYNSSDRNILIGYIKGELTASKKENIKRTRLVTSSLKEILELAEKKKVKILIEVINHTETNFITDIASGIEFVSGFKSDYLKLLIDTYHMSIDEKDCYNSIKEAGPFIGYIHIADIDRKFPGYGNIDFRPALKALNAIDYNGYLMLECNDKNSINSANNKSRYKVLEFGHKYIKELIQNLH